MSNRFSRTLAPLNLDLTPSRLLPLLHVGVAFAALAAIAMAALPSPWSLVLFIGVVAIAVLARPRQNLRHLQFDREWRGFDDNGREESLVLKSAVVWPGLIVLRFALAGARRQRVLILLPGCMAADDWRRLRLYLAHGGVFPQRAT